MRRKNLNPPTSYQPVQMIIVLTVRQIRPLKPSCHPQSPRMQAHWRQGLILTG